MLELLPKGANITQCYCDLLGLELDLGKTYVWGTTPALRKGSAILQMPVLDSARELGGIFSFGPTVPSLTDALTCHRCCRNWLAPKALVIFAWELFPASFGLKLCMVLLGAQFPRALFRACAVRWPRLYMYTQLDPALCFVSACVL